jgi:hypothetical protein
MDGHSNFPSFDICNGKIVYRIYKIIGRHESFESRPIVKEHTSILKKNCQAVMVGQVHKLFVTILTAFLFQPLERSAERSGL